MFSSAVNALFPAALGNFTTDMSQMGIRIGFIFRTTTYATSTGTPTVGAIVESAEGYLRVELLAAYLLMNGGSFLMMDGVLGSKMSSMVRMSVNVEDLQSHFTICIYH